MAKQSMSLDPDAQSYTDDEIVGKVNAATVKVDADSCEDGITNKVFTATDETKLTGIEASATVDQTGAEIKTAYEAEANAYTDTLNTKLGAIEAAATADQTGAEIKTAYEAEANAYTDTKDTKLTGVEDSATADQTGTEIQTAVLALADADRKLIKTDPQVGEFDVLAVQRASDGKLDVDYDDVAKV